MRKGDCLKLLFCFLLRQTILLDLEAHMEKSKKNGSKKPYTKKKVLLDVIIMAVIMLLSYLLPYVSYTYNKNSYSLLGIRFLTGTRVMKWSVIITTNYYALTLLIISILLIITAIFFYRIKIRIAGMLLTVLGILELLLSFLLSKNMISLLSKGKNVSPGIGTVLLICVGVALIIRSLY